MNELGLDVVMIALGWVFVAFIAVYILLMTYMIIDGWWNTLKIRQSDLTLCREQRDYYREKLDEAQKRVNELQERIDFLTRGEVRL